MTNASNPGASLGAAGARRAIEATIRQKARRDSRAVTIFDFMVAPSKSKESIAGLQLAKLLFRSNPLPGIEGSLSGRRSKVACWLPMSTKSTSCSAPQFPNASAQATEIPLMGKTWKEPFSAIIDAVKACHPYETPSITASELITASPDYAAWIGEVTAKT